MKWFRKRSRAQSVLEYSIIVSLVIGTFFGLQTFFKRAYQAKMANTVEDTIMTDLPEEYRGYEPYYQASSLDSTQTSDQTYTTSVGGAVSITGTDTTSRTGTRTTKGIGN